MNNPWMSWWSAFPQLTDLSQNISPNTSWFSPTVEYNFAGNRAVEADVVSNVASYGRQLGILTDAVLELGEDNDDPAMKRLRGLAEKIAERKKERKQTLEEDLQAKLDGLGESDPAMLERLIRRYAK